jgi:ubiquitin carboxyl-terminal hydrolase L3
LLEQSKELSSAHEASAQGGQTAVPDLQDDVDLHFVAFINHDGSLIELDGRRNSPINHGKIVVDLLEVSHPRALTIFSIITDPSTGQDTVEVVKNVIEISGSLQFNLITLSPTPKDE